MIWKICFDLYYGFETEQNYLIWSIYSLPRLALVWSIQDWRNVPDTTILIETDVVLVQMKIFGLNWLKFLSKNAVLGMVSEKSNFLCNSKTALYYNWTYCVYGYCIINVTIWILTPEIRTFDFSDDFLSVFKWSDHMIRRNIWKPDILDHFVWFSDHHSKTRPFDNQTCLGIKMVTVLALKTIQWDPKTGHSNTWCLWHPVFEWFISLDQKGNTRSTKKYDDKIKAFS